MKFAIIALLTVATNAVVIRMKENNCTITKCYQWMEHAPIAHFTKHRKQMEDRAPQKFAPADK